MQAEYYKNGILVSGDTRPWYGYLKQLGGKWGQNFEGARNGWIFGKAKEAEIIQLVAQANAGTLPHSPKEQQVQVQPLITTPKLILQPRLQIAPQPTIMGAPAMPAIQFPAAQIAPQQQFLTPQIATPQVAKLPVIPQLLLGAVPQTVQFTNHFEAGDGLTYQIILYTVPLPYVNQKVTLKYGETSSEYTVTSIKETSPIDDFHITSDENPEQLSHVVLINGQWKINLMEADHSIIFHK